MYKTTKLPELISQLGAHMPTYVPMTQNAVLNFALWEANTPWDMVNLTGTKTVTSPKAFFLPSLEVLYSGSVDNGQITITPGTLQDTPFVLFGVRACDAKGIATLDGLYLDAPIDKFYESRRKAATIITMACAQPALTCFCHAFDIDPAAPMGDVTTWLADDTLYWQPNTEKGETLTAALGHVLTQTTETVDALQEDIRESIAAKPHSSLPVNKFTQENMLDIFHAPAWDTLHQTCLACGTCAYLCPTCQCYDIAQFDGGQCVKTHRCWDTCMNADFTQMAHGNPRNTHKERFRQRFMHKLVYHPQAKDGALGCVGCGRCTNKCPANISIATIVNAIHVGGDSHV